jgi:hypothetical protein
MTGTNFFWTLALVLTPLQQGLLYAASALLSVVGLLVCLYAAVTFPLPLWVPETVRSRLASVGESVRMLRHHPAEHAKTDATDAQDEEPLEEPLAPASEVAGSGGESVSVDNKQTGAGRNAQRDDASVDSTSDAPGQTVAGDADQSET